MNNKWIEFIKISLFFMLLFNFMLIAIYFLSMVVFSFILWDVYFYIPEINSNSLAVIRLLEFVLFLFSVSITKDFMNVK
jgi:hypothetical protein